MIIFNNLKSKKYLKRGSISSDYKYEQNRIKESYFLYLICYFLLYQIIYYFRVLI